MAQCKLVSGSAAYEAGVGDVSVGIKTFMNHMEGCHPSLQPLIMSVIADLLRKSKAAHDCLRMWKSNQSNMTAVELLLHLWREAESEWQVCTHGVLTSVHKPLAGSGKRSLWIPKHEVRTSQVGQRPPFIILY